MAQANIGIHRQLDNGVLRLSFERPERKNAITQGMYTALADALLEADAAPDVRAIVLHGSAEAFTAGNDIGDFAAVQAAEGERPSARFMRAVVRLRKPLIAAVNGPAVGIGATVLLHCDLVYAGSNATLLFPFVKLGLCPEFGSSLLLARRIGPQQASRLLLLAEPCTAAQALALGLVTEVLEPSESINRALAAAAKLAAASPDAVMTTRRLMRQSCTDEITARIALENEYFGRLLQTPQAQATFAAFLNKARD